MAFDDLIHDVEPQTDASRSGGPDRNATLEGVEEDGQELRGDWPVLVFVTNNDSCAIALDPCCENDRSALSTMGLRIGEQIRNHLSKAVGVPLAGPNSLLRH